MRGGTFPPIPSEPPPDLVAQNIGPPKIAVVEACNVLGGHGFGFPRDASVRLTFTQTEITIIMVSAPGQSRQVARWREAVPYSEVEVIEIGGPGRTTRSGGFGGGGFGLNGAAEGMMIAAALNLLTTRSQTNTVVCLRTHSAEIFLHHRQQTPNELRMTLSEVFTILRQLQAERAQQPTTSSSGDHVLSGLSKLSDLLGQGLITPEEFATLKERLLSS